MMTRGEWRGLVYLRATFNGLAETLIREHVPDRHGRHCRGCQLPQSGNVVWPCTLHNLGAAALKARGGVAPVIPLRRRAG